MPKYCYIIVLIALGILSSCEEDKVPGDFTQRNRLFIIHVVDENTGANMISPDGPYTPGTVSMRYIISQGFNASIPLIEDGDNGRGFMPTYFRQDFFQYGVRLGPLREEIFQISYDQSRSVTEFTYNNTVFKEVTDWGTRDTIRVQLAINPNECEALNWVTVMVEAPEGTDPEAEIAMIGSMTNWYYNSDYVLQNSEGTYSGCFPLSEDDTFYFSRDGNPEIFEVDGSCEQTLHAYSSDQGSELTYHLNYWSDEMVSVQVEVPGSTLQGTEIAILRLATDFEYDPEWALKFSEGIYQGCFPLRDGNFFYFTREGNVDFKEATNECGEIIRVYSDSAGQEVHYEIEKWIDLDC